MRPIERGKAWREAWIASRQPKPAGSCGEIEARTIRDESGQIVATISLAIMQGRAGKRLPLYSVLDWREHRRHDGRMIGEEKHRHYAPFRLFSEAWDFAKSL